MTDPIVQVRNLRKRYGPLIAVDGVSFEVRREEIFGILGPNGAGKTTTLEMLEGLRTADDGSALIDGVDVRRDPRGVRARIGVQLQEAGFFDRLTVEETLRLFAAFHGRPAPVAALLERLQLTEKRRAWVRTLSGGQRQRLAIAVALVHDPPLLFLDEPTTGLDPQARRNLWDIIETLRRDGRTVILTTHYMEEAQRLCDRVAIMDHGRIVALDAPRALIRAHAPTATVVLAGADASTTRDAALAALPAVRQVEQANGEVRLATADPVETVQAVLALLRAGTLRFTQLRVEEATLEDVFLHLTGRRLRE
ncbi:MAG: ABC transporter ATP-binding protein [Firmicutes bacterium]|nr:ABC transporter ATP-binding protein [Bacillota bacterium]